MDEYVYRLISERIPQKVSCRYRKDGDHYLAYSFITNGTVSSLNRLAGEILELCDGCHSIGDITDLLSERYSEVSKIVIGNDVMRCVRDLERKNLVTVVASDGISG